MAENWSQEWREDVARQLAENARAQQNTAVIQERMLGRLDRHDEDIKRLDARPDLSGSVANHESRLATLEKQPGTSRANQAFYLSIISAAIAALWLLINVLPHLVYHP